MALDEIDRIRALTLIALVSDDEFMELLVLKGANALSLIHGVRLRASVDLDFSMESDFREPDLDLLRQRFEKLFCRTFKENGYEIFDVRFTREPPDLSEELEDFWGGYRLEFKIIESHKYKELSGDINALRRQSVVIDDRQRKRLRVDISKHEFCSPRQEVELDGYTFYVYTPTMIVCEKLRAICQQMPEYGEIIKSRSQSARPRDFFDIYNIVERFGIQVHETSSMTILRAMFEAKKVPLSLLGKIEESREFHRSGFSGLELTVGPETDLRDFDFYFDYVLHLVDKLKPLWIK